MMAETVIAVETGSESVVALVYSYLEELSPG